MKKHSLAILLAALLLVTSSACSSHRAKNEQASPSETDHLPITNASPNVSDPSQETPSNSNTEVYDPNTWVNPGELTGPYAIANAATKASPSVVAITTEVVTYGGFYGNYVSEGAGSGVIYSENGYIITNNHVIENADTVRVTLINGDSYDATVVGADAITDIAVLKIEATGLCAATANKNSLQVGQPVIAIGNPMGTLSGTVTSGIVSALSRTILVENIAMELLQFDAAVSPGNSGGGLFDINGNLIAIVNAKSSGDGVEGISFAIPVTRAIDITEQFIKNGYISGRPSLGVKTESITSTNYESFRNSELWEYATIGSRIYPGIYITSDEKVIYKNANEAFAYGDRIIKIGTTEISDESDIIAALSSHQIGQTVAITVARLTTTSSIFGGSNYTYQSVTVEVILQENTLTSSDNVSGGESL